MTDPLELAYTRTYPVEVERAHDLVLAAPLPEIFDRRYLLIPPIAEVRDQDGAWDTVGRTRTVVLSDGGTMHERLVELVPGDHFRYRLDQVTGLLKPLLDHVEGGFHFEPAGTGVRVTWTWRVATRGPQGELARPVLARLWRGYARLGFDRIEDLLLARA